MLHLRTGVRVLLATALLVCAARPSFSQGVAPPGTELTREQMAHFLATARIVADADIPVGVTRPMRLTLDDGRMRHDAAFSMVDERLPIMRFKNHKTELDFVDSYRYSIAAYRVAELVGLDHMMPVTIEREWQRRKGALSWWLDDVMDERERLKRGAQPPDPEEWSRQVQRMRLFAQLVGDTDRNMGNMLVDRGWKLWMIDFTRAFRRTRELLNVNDLQRCDRQLLPRLSALTTEEVTERTKPYIGGAEIAALLARRDLIVARCAELVAERGEERVLY